MNNKNDMMKFSTLVKDKLPKDVKILIESEVPDFCAIGNLNFAKQYHAAIKQGLRLLKKDPYSAGIHVNLMDSYFKIRNEKPEYISKSIYHARLAMLYGHNTGYVQQKLAINLEKTGKIRQALEVCNIVLLNEFHFSSHGCGNKVDFVKRKEKLEKKLSKMNNTDSGRLFSDEEIFHITELIRKEDEITNPRKLFVY